MKLDNSSRPIKIWHVPVRLILYLADNLNNGYKMKLLRSSDSPYVFHRKANQLVLVIKGSGFAYLENELMVIKPGEVIYFPAGLNTLFLLTKN